MDTFTQPATETLPVRNQPRVNPKKRNRPVVAVLTCSIGRSVGEKCPHKKYVDTYAKCVGVAGAMFQGSRSAMQFTG